MNSSYHLKRQSPFSSYYRSSSLFSLLASCFDFLVLIELVGKTFVPFLSIHFLVRNNGNGFNFNCHCWSHIPLGKTYFSVLFNMGTRKRFWFHYLNGNITKTCFTCFCGNRKHVSCGNPFPTLFAAFVLLRRFSFQEMKTYPWRLHVWYAFVNVLSFTLKVRICISLITIYIK